MQLTHSEWALMSVLWSGERFALKEIADALKAELGWSKNTVHTYLTRMADKGFVAIDRGEPRPYRAAISRADCAGHERRDLLERVYHGATGELITAFLKDSTITAPEISRLKKLLDEMEV